MRFYLTEVCGVLAATADECSQHTVRQSVAAAASILVADTHSQLTSEEMRRMRMVMQWCLAGILLTRTLAGWW